MLPETMPSTSKGTTSGSSVSAPKVQRIDCSGRTQRRGRRQRAARAEALPQRIDFGQGKLRMIAGTISAMIVFGRPARLLDDGDVEIALLRVGMDMRLIERGQPGGRAGSPGSPARAPRRADPCAPRGHPRPRGQAANVSASRRGVEYSRAS